jgi:hypothetical protein
MFSNHYSSLLLLLTHTPVNLVVCSEHPFCSFLFLSHVVDWDQETTIIQLIRKAGYKGKIDMSKIRIVTTRFQTATAHTHYNDYIKARSSNHNGPITSHKNKHKK